MDSWAELPEDEDSSFTCLNLMHDGEDDDDGECSSSTSVAPDGMYTVEEILEYKVENGEEYWRVRWAGYGPNDDTWEPRENFGDNEFLQEFEAQRIATFRSEGKGNCSNAAAAKSLHCAAPKLRSRRPSVRCPPSAPKGRSGKKKANARMSVPLLQAKALLHTSRMPKELLKREKECKEIHQFMLNCVKRTSMLPSGGPRVLYISGVPGTGKTAAVLKVQNEMKAKKGTANFDFVGINALELSDPRQLFTKVYGAVQENCAGTRKKYRNAQQFLDDYFAQERTKRTPIVILVDEVDMLYTKREDVLYTVFNWANLCHSRCSVVAISNTLDLAERKFSQRVVSRMGTNRLIFQPYEFKEIEEIVAGRLKECPKGAFIPSAVELASKKVAAISGDLRKAFELLRRGIDIALEQCNANGSDPVEQRLTVQHVLEAIRESQCSVRMEFVLALSFHELLLFRALVHVLHTAAVEVTRFSALLPHYRQLCFGDAAKPLTLEAAFHHMREMDSMHLVRLDPGEGGQLHRRVQLGFSLSEAQFCLRQMETERHKENIGQGTNE